MTGDNHRSGMGTGLATAGAGLLLVACCAGPALVAGGALAAVGGVLRSPWLLAAAAAVLLAALVYTLRRRAHRPRAVAVDCCPPASVPSDPADLAHPADPKGSRRR